MGMKLDLLTLREEHRLRVFEHRVMRRIFGPKRDEVKPRKRWLDAVKENSYQMLKWRDWEVKVQDRGEWRLRIKKAKAL
jgi:hypothetical protein